MEPESNSSRYFAGYDEIVLKLVAALGIDPNGVSEVILTILPSEFVDVRLTRYLDREKFVDAIEVVEKYRLIPRPAAETS